MHAIVALIIMGHATENVIKQNCLKTASAPSDLRIAALCINSTGIISLVASSKLFDSLDCRCSWTSGLSITWM